jgi:hypothetical protein
MLALPKFGLPSTNSSAMLPRRKLLSRLKPSTALSFSVVGGFLLAGFFLLAALNSSTGDGVAAGLEDLLMECGVTASRVISDELRLAGSGAITYQFAKHSLNCFF